MVFMAVILSASKDLGIYYPGNTGMLRSASA